MRSAGCISERQIQKVITILMFITFTYIWIYFLPIKNNTYIINVLKNNNTQKVNRVCGSININQIENEVSKDSVQQSIISIEEEQEIISSSNDEFMVICSVVEAETHGGDQESKIHIVHVIRNRVLDGRFGYDFASVC